MLMSLLSGKAHRDVKGGHRCECNNKCTHGLHCEMVCSGNGICLNDSDSCHCHNSNITGYYGDKCQRRGCSGFQGKECAYHGERRSNF